MVTLVNGLRGRSAAQPFESGRGTNSDSPVRRRREAVSLIDLCEELSAA